MDEKNKVKISGWLKVYIFGLPYTTRLLRLSAFSLIFLFNSNNYCYFWMKF